MILTLSGNADSLNILKLSVLYFDDISIQIPFVMDAGKESDSEYRFTATRLLGDDLNNQVIWLKEKHDIPNEMIFLNGLEYKFHDEELYNSISKASQKLILENFDLIFENAFTDGERTFSFTEETTVQSSEMKEILSSLSAVTRNAIKKSLMDTINGPDYIYDLLFSYLLTRMQLSKLMFDLSDNRIVLSDLQLINDLLLRYYQKKDVLSIMQNQVKLNCTSILLPNLSDATFEDIFELKYKMRDELLELHNYLDSLIDNVDMENPDSFNILTHKINRAVRNLESKIKDINIAVAQKFITEIKNPLSYAPLLGTFFANVPSHVSLFVSLGLIGLNTGLEYTKQLNNLKKDNMYFLFKLRK